MKLTARDTRYDFSERDTVVLFLPEGYQDGKGAVIPEGISHITNQANLGFFKGKSGECAFIPLAGEPALIIAGLGKPDEITRETLRNASASAVDTARRIAPYSAKPARAGSGVTRTWMSTVAPGAMVGDRHPAPVSGAVMSFPPAGAV